MAEAVGAIAVSGAGSVAMEEAKSALATLLGHVMRILRDFLMWCVSMFEKVVTFAGTHPEAMFLSVGNAIIWMS